MILIVFRLITRNTIEESIMSSQKFKIHTARLVLYILNIKGTDTISSDPSCKDGNARFTTMPLKPKYDQQCETYRRFSGLMFISISEKPQMRCLGSI